MSMWIFADVYLRFSRGCGRVPQSSGGLGLAPVPFVVYPPSSRGGWFHKTELFLQWCSVVVVLCMLIISECDSDQPVKMPNCHSGQGVLTTFS
jgi:hypothetical protein